jgi:hypothetical protein
VVGAVVLGGADVFALDERLERIEHARSCRIPLEPSSTAPDRSRRDWSTRASEETMMDLLVTVPVVASG